MGSGLSKHPDTDGFRRNRDNREGIDDRSEWGKVGDHELASKPVDNHIEPDVVVKLETSPYSPEVITKTNWRESLAEAWPVISILLIVFGFIVLGINSVSWSVAQTPTRWPPVLMTIIFFLVAFEKGKRKQSIQFLFFYLVGLITALWI